jgi:allantoicase
MNDFESEMLDLIERNQIETAVPLSDEFFNRIEALKQQAEQLQSNQGN